MRKITFKRYFGFADRSVPHFFGNGVQVVLDMDKKPAIEYDRSWVHVREGYEIITYHVPAKFDLVYRYLRLHGLAKYVHDYPSFVKGWGWSLEVGNSLQLTFRNPSPALNEPTSTLVAGFRTRQERRHAMKMVVLILKDWRNKKFGDPDRATHIERMARSMWSGFSDAAEISNAAWDAMEKSDREMWVDRAKVIYEISIDNEIQGIPKLKKPR